MSSPTPTCRLCGADALAPAFRLERAAGNISRMLRPDEVGLIPAAALEVFRCGRCGFVQLTRTLGESFYDDYLMGTSHSPQMRAYQQEQAADFVRTYDLAGKRVLEVGCGDGTYLGALAAAGAIVSGIEPSARFRAEAERTPYPVYAGYVDAETPAPGEPYDAFVTRQVFEHVPDLHRFIQGIRASLAPGAAGLIEVPSLEQALEGRRFYDFFPDHLNYYSARTLRLAFEMHGFVVDAVERGMHGEYLVASVRLEPAPALEDLGRAALEIADDLTALVAAAREAGERVAVWGAGGKGVTTLAVSGVEDLAYVVDSDPHKHGRLTPVTHLPIYPPTRLLEDPVDVVVVTALAYRHEVLRTLRDELAFPGRVYALGPRLELVAEAGATPAAAPAAA